MNVGEMLESSTLDELKMNNYIVHMHTYVYVHVAGVCVCDPTSA